MNCPQSPLPTILVVEDEILIRNCTTDHLTDAGFSVIAAGDAEEGLRKFNGHLSVTTLFTDINMPGRFDGLSLAHMICKLRPGVQLIITSGLAPGKGELPEGGHFLTKPYDCISLTALIKAA
jgi:DNA-binding response OmpR family regulator